MSRKWLLAVVMTGILGSFLILAVNQGTRSDGLACVFIWWGGALSGWAGAALYIAYQKWMQAKLTRSRRWSRRFRYEDDYFYDDAYYGNRDDFDDGYDYRDGPL